MNRRLNRYVVTALFGLASLMAGCAAKDVNVISQRGPIRGEATIEGDKTTTQSEQNKRKSSGSGAVSGSGSLSGSGATLNASQSNAAYRIEW
jgi:hypothetical protein